MQVITFQGGKIANPQSGVKSGAAQAQQALGNLLGLGGKKPAQKPAGDQFVKTPRK